MLGFWGWRLEDWGPGTGNLELGTTTTIGRKKKHSEKQNNNNSKATWPRYPHPHKANN